MSQETMLTAEQENTTAEDTSTDAEATASEETTQEANTEESTETESSEPKEDAKEGNETEDVVVPEQYEFKLPKDARLSDVGLEGISQVSKDLGLSQEQANKLAETVNSTLDSYAEAQNQWLAEQSDSWVEEIRTDEKIGGANLDSSMKHASRVIQRYGSEALVKFLDETKMGNAPELVRTFVRIGKDMAEDSLVRGEKSPSGAKKSPEEVLYPSQGKEE